MLDPHHPVAVVAAQPGATEITVEARHLHPDVQAKLALFDELVEELGNHCCIHVQRVAECRYGCENRASSVALVSRAFAIEEESK